MLKSVKLIPYIQKIDIIKCVVNDNNLKEKLIDWHFLLVIKNVHKPTINKSRFSNEILDQFIISFSFDWDYTQMVDIILFQKIRTYRKLLNTIKKPTTKTLM